MFWLVKAYQFESEDDIYFCIKAVIYWLQGELRVVLNLRTVEEFEILNLDFTFAVYFVSV